MRMTDFVRFIAGYTALLTLSSLPVPITAPDCRYFHLSDKKIKIPYILFMFYRYL